MNHLSALAHHSPARGEGHVGVAVTERRFVRRARRTSWAGHLSEWARGLGGRDGGFGSSINREGKFKINLRADAGLKKSINAPDAYTGHMANKSRIGLDNAGYKELWDADHSET